MAGPGDGARERPLALDAVLAEYSSLRDEIGQRSGAQHTVLGLSVTVAATVLGLVLSTDVDDVLGDARARLLLVLPVALPALGLIWFDQARNIDRLGNLLGGPIRDALVAMVDDERVLLGEANVRAFEKTGWLGPRASLATALLLLYVVLPVTALALTMTTDGVFDGGLALVWIAGLAATLVVAGSLRRFVSRADRPDP